MSQSDIQPTINTKRQELESGQDNKTVMFKNSVSNECKQKQ